VIAPVADPNLALLRRTVRRRLVTGAAVVGGGGARADVCRAQVLPGLVPTRRIVEGLAASIGWMLQPASGTGYQSLPCKARAASANCPVGVVFSSSSI